MPPRFGNFNSPDGRYWSPDYGDIDWSMARDRMVEAGELEPYQPVGFDSGDDLIQECHQENTVFRLSRVNPNMDMVAESDPRDGKDYIWFRDQDPERYEYLLRTLGRAALIMESEYPLPDTVAIYLKRAETGNDPSFLDQPDE